MSGECPYGGGDHRELIRQAEQQGREDNADHDMCYVHGSKALEALIRQAKAEERELWVQRLAALCDDDWLRRRDRAMELPGAKGHRWERKAASAWERASHQVRSVLNDLANYEDEYGHRHGAYMAWMQNGRDEPRVSDEPGEGA